MMTGDPLNNFVQLLLVTCLPSHFLHTLTFSPERPFPMYKSLIRVLPQIRHVPLPRDGMRQSALPRLFLDINSPPLRLIPYLMSEGTLKFGE